MPADGAACVAIHVVEMSIRDRKKVGINVGFLSGDEAAGAFLVKRGYRAGRRVGLFQRSLARLTTPADPRFVAMRGQYDIIAGAMRRPGWWLECVLGPVEAVE